MSFFKTRMASGFQRGLEQRKNSGSDFKIRATNFKIQGTYFFPYNFWSFSMGNSMVKKLVLFGFI